MSARFYAVFFIPLLLFLLPGCTGSGSTPPAEAAAAPPMPVKVVRAESRKIERSIAVTGSLQPDEVATVSNELAGMLAAVHVDFGQVVRRGQIIAELDKREQELQYDRARAALAQALARIGLKPNEEETEPETTPAIRQAQAQLDNARTKYESAARLIKTGDIAQDRYVELEKAYNAAQAALDAARHDLRMSLANIQSLRAEVRLAEKRLRDAVITAPFDGAVTERLASPGEYLRQNTPIVRIVKTNPLRLRVDIPESAAAAVRLGTELSFTTSALPGDTFTATVREIDPALDARSRSLKAEARLNRPDPRLKPGMFVQVRLVTQKEADIVVIPSEAVYTVAGLTKVFTIKDGRAAEHKVLLGERREGWVEIRGDSVRPGDAVAVDRLAELVDGAPVSGVPAAS